MDNKELIYFRQKLSKTQRQIADLLGTSIKAVQSYEQGWRQIPAHVERQILFLVSRKNKNRKRKNSCWTIKNCPPKLKKMCPAWEFRSGDLCWFINGTICEGEVKKDWNEKIKICQACEVFKSFVFS